MTSSFPASFVWGAATSAYQIEGAARTDGRGDSVWDMYCRKPGSVWLGNTGDVACDHYNRFGEDTGLMKRLGIGAYRFSISWPRVMPEGTGRVNDAGLAFYDRLVDSLLAAGVTPWVTLFHWDYPSALFERGGWNNRESVKWFADYTKVVVDRLSDRVSQWMTINEPHIFIGGGPEMGPQAPGTNLPLKERLAALHHVLMAHGESVRMIRAHAKKKPSIGWAPCGVVGIPMTGSAEDLDAAERWTHGVRGHTMWNNAWYADPIILGGYPEEGLRAYGENAPRVQGGDMEMMKAPIDFYGVNIYNGWLVRRGADGSPEFVATRPDGYAKTQLDWPVEPESLYYGPKWLSERYKLPVYITENGLSAMDWVHADGKVHDPQRIDFTRRYLLELRRACRDGANIGGYFHWSLLDNFEWENGYRQRFGLIHVDYATLKRTPKDSFEWYRKVVASNGHALDENPFAG